MCQIHGRSFSLISVSYPSFLHDFGRFDSLRMCYSRSRYFGKLKVGAHSVIKILNTVISSGPKKKKTKKKKFANSKQPFARAGKRFASIYHIDTAGTNHGGEHIFGKLREIKNLHQGT